jgi:hypothetical protein
MVLRTDHMFQCIAELFGQSTVRDEHESDHRWMAPVMAPSQALFILATPATWERYLVETWRVDKP